MIKFHGDSFDIKNLHDFYTVDPQSENEDACEVCSLIWLVCKRLLGDGYIGCENNLSYSSREIIIFTDFVVYNSKFM
jgi:hypothetical protein